MGQLCPYSIRRDQIIVVVLDSLEASATFLLFCDHEETESE